jgi:hypothetical protein
VITDVVEISEVKRSEKNTALAFLAQPFLVMKKGGNLVSKRFILFAPEFADFVGDLLRSFRQKSSVSVRSQKPTIPRP